MLDLKWTKGQFRDAAALCGVVGTLLGAISAILISYGLRGIGTAIAVPGAAALAISAYLGLRAVLASDLNPSAVVPAGMQIAIALSLLLAVGVAGFLAGGAGRAKATHSPATGRPSSNGQLSVRVPNGWSAHRAHGSRLGLGDPIVLTSNRSPRTVVLVGSSSASGPSLLSQGLRGRFGARLPRSNRVALGRLQAYRYSAADAHATGTRLVVFTAPATIGVVTIVCSAYEGQRPDFGPQCEQIARTTTLASGHALPLGPSRQYASAVNGILGRLSARRVRAHRGMRAAMTQGRQAHAAHAAGEAFADAVIALRGVGVAPADAQAQLKLIDALRGAEQIYVALADAARRGDAAAYTRWKGRVQDGVDRVHTALTRFAALGYDVPG